MPKQLENGYLAIGKQKVEFHRTEGEELAMPEPNQNPPATVPEQPEAKPPLEKSMPVVIALVVIIALIGIANLSSLVSGNKKSRSGQRIADAPSDCESAAGDQLRDPAADAGAAGCRGAAAPAGAGRRDAAASAAQSVPGPEADGTPPMTAAQRAAIYGDSPNAPKQTSNVSQAQAEAKQKALAREKQQQDAINSDTVAIDFAHPAVPLRRANARAGRTREFRDGAIEAIRLATTAADGQRPGSVQVTTAQTAEV